MQWESHIDTCNNNFFRTASHRYGPRPIETFESFSPTIAPVAAVPKKEGFQIPFVDNVRNYPSKPANGCRVYYKKCPRDVTKTTQGVENIDCALNRGKYVQDTCGPNSIVHWHKYTNNLPDIENSSIIKTNDNNNVNSIPYLRAPCKMNIATGCSKNKWVNDQLMSGTLYHNGPDCVMVQKDIQNLCDSGVSLK